MGISVSSDKVDQAAKKIRCAILQVPFSYLVPTKVLLNMESIRNHFFNGIEHNGKKPIWVKWNKVLASKEKGGLGVLSFYALKWVWHFCTQQSALWTKIIKGIHGEDGKIDKHDRSHHPSLWLDIVKEVHHIQRQGTDLMGFIHRKIGNGGTFGSRRINGGATTLSNLTFPECMHWRLKTIF
ncbi:hypothetical protein Tco_1341574 [Tanacetum coccineum]